MSHNQSLSKDALEQTDNSEMLIVWTDYIPGVVLIVPMVIAFLSKFLGDDGMSGWAVSRQGLFSGHIENLQLHMFAHGSAVHIMMNCMALYSISALVVRKLGGGVAAWVRFLLLFELAGLGGAATFLTLHQWNDVPMLGASGAIFGLIGFLVRIPADGADAIPVWSPEMLKLAIGLIKDHFWLFLIFGLPPLLLGRSGGLAWEAHLGGFLVGLFFCPYLIARRANAY